MRRWSCCGSACATPRASPRSMRGALRRPDRGVRGARRAGAHQSSRITGDGAPAAGDEAQLDFFAALPPALARECRRAERSSRGCASSSARRAPFTVLATEAVTELVARRRAGAHAARSHRCHRRRAASCSTTRAAVPAVPTGTGSGPTHPQLLAYLSALGRGGGGARHRQRHDARGALLRRRGASRSCCRGCRCSRGATPARCRRRPGRAQREAWRAPIASLISAFLAGEARVDPAAGACDYCHLGALCRIGAHPGAAETAPLPGMPMTEDAPLHG